MSDLPPVVTRFVGDARSLLAATAEARAAVKAYAEDAKKYAVEQTATVRQSQATQANEVKKYQAEQAAAVKARQTEMSAATRQYQAEQGAELKRWSAEQKATLATSDSEKAAELARFRETEKAATARFQAEELAATRRYTAEQNALLRTQLAEQRAMRAKAAEESGASRALTKVVGGSPIGSAVGGEAFLGMGAGGMAVGAAAMGIGALAVGITAVSIESLKMAGNFESATVRLVTSAGEDHKNLDMIRQGLLQMSGQVGVSAQDLAKAMYIVDSAQIHGADSLKVLRAAVEGAKTEGADIGVVANAVTTVLNDYHLKAEDAAKVTSMLVAATSAGKTSFEGLTSALHSVLPAAGALHVPLETILGDIAAMTVHGMSPEQVTQNLNHVMLKMQKFTSTQLNEFALLHLSANQVSDSLSQKGLGGTLEMLHERIANMMPAGSNKVIIDMRNAVKGLDPTVQSLAGHIFDGSMSMKEYAKAAASLDPIHAKQAMQFATLVGSTHRIGNEQLTGAQIMQTYAAAMASATGDQTGYNVAMMLTGENLGLVTNATKTVKDATVEAGGHVKGWSDIQGTLNQQLSEFKSGLEAIGIKIGNALMPKVKEFFDAIKDVGKKMKEALDHPDIKDAVDNLGKSLSKVSSDDIKSMRDSLKELAGFFDKNHESISSLINFMANDVVPVLSWVGKMGFGTLILQMEGLMTQAMLLKGDFDWMRSSIVANIKLMVSSVLEQFDWILTGIVKLIEAMPGVPKSWKKELDAGLKNFHSFKDGVLSDIDSLDGRTANVYVQEHYVADKANPGWYTSGASMKHNRDNYRADGGPVEAGQSYLVGENGPELITPTHAGYVHTAANTRQMLGNGSQTTFSGSARSFSAPATGGGGGGSQTIAVRLPDINLDGRKLYEGVVVHAQRHKGRNPNTALV